MKKWLLAPLIVATPFAIPFSTTVCGCSPQGTIMSHVIGVYPMNATPEVSRDAFLRTFPEGTAEARQKEGRMGLVLKTHCAPTDEPVGYKCTFEEEKVNSLFVRYTEGYQMDLHLDSRRELKDVRFTKFRRK